jgi:PcRGLX-like protein central beta sandwich domain/PcRGLX-like N-terminal RIFT barrel domain
MTKLSTTIASLCLALTLGLSASALEVKLSVSDTTKTARQAGTVSAGVPFPKGKLKNIKKLALFAAGKPIPVQFRKLARWDDGSVRWALLDTVVDVPAGGKTELTLKNGAPMAPSSPVKVADTASEVTVNTGAMTLVLDKKSGKIFKSIKIGGKEVITAGTRGLVIYTADKKQVLAAAPTEVKVEESGPVKVVVMLRGKFPGIHNNLLGYTVRVTVYTGKKFFKLRIWLENHGKAGFSPFRTKVIPNEWFAFDGMAVELGLAGGGLSAECEGIKASGKFKVFQTCKNSPKYAPPAHGWKKFEYTITGGAGKKGARTEGVVSISGGGLKLTTAVRNFWENYDKAIELDGSNLKMWLWPTEGCWPRRFFQHACPGYARNQIHPLMKKELYNLPGSVHKSAEMIFDFSGRTAAESKSELSNPLFALATPAYYAGTEAAPGLFAPPETRTGDDECNAKLDSWVNMTKSVADRKSKSSIWHARTTQDKAGNAVSDGYWYGWMDFGDLSNPGCGYTSLHYDWPWVVSVNLMRTGDLNFLRLADEMVRHRVEVDQQWSDRELPSCHGFQRKANGYRQFHTSRFNYCLPTTADTWLAGITVYYMLTGDQQTLDAINRCLKNIEPAWKERLASKNYGVRRSLGNMRNVAQTSFAYCSGYAIDGDKKWLDKALWLFKRLVLPKAKTYGPHLHDRNQIRSQDYTADDIRYCYSIQSFCYLHHVTKDKTVFDLLQKGCDAEFPENFFDAPLFLADLHGYVALVTGKSDYADDGVEHWIEASPESKFIPVFQRNNSKWTERKAMHMRTGHLLQRYFWKKGKK